MKNSNSLILVIILIIMSGLFSSCVGNLSFNHEEIRFTDPFKETSVIVYKSALGQVDSIKFFKRQIDTIKYRNLSQGFYNENILRVKYQLLDHSYHKINYGAGLSNYDLKDNYLTFLKSKNGHSDKEISFLGLQFDKDYINRILNTKQSVIVFDSENAQYKSVNINEGIKSFEFDFKKGIISFIDKNGVEWIRLNR